MGKKSFGDNIDKIDSIKSFVESLCGTKFGYELTVEDINIKDELKAVCKGNTHNMFRGADKYAIRDKFNEDVDRLTHRDSTAAIRFFIYGESKNDVKLDERVVLRERYDNADTALARPDEDATAQPQPQPQPQPQVPNAQLDAFKQVTNVLMLMGFGGLAGADDGTGGLNQILQVRDGLNEQRHANEKKDEKITQMAADLARAEMERDQLKQDKEKLQHQIEKRDERIEELEIELDEKDEQIRKLHPEFSLMGTSLTALLGAGIKNFAMAHANTIGGLMGVDGDSLRTMLANDEQALPANEAEADDNSDGRAEQFKMIRDFVKSLTDKEFEDYWQLMRVFAANKDTIAIVLAMAKGGSEAQAQPNDDVEQQ